MAITFQPERGRFDLWVPGAAIGELRKMFDPTLKNAADR